MKGIHRHAHTHTHLMWTQRELRSEDFLFVFQGCALLTLLEGKVFVLVTWRRARRKELLRCKMKSSMRGGSTANCNHIIALNE